MPNGLFDYALSRAQSYIDSHRKQSLEKNQPASQKKSESASSKLPDLVRDVKNTSNSMNK